MNQIIAMVGVCVRNTLSFHENTCMHFRILHVNMLILIVTCSGKIGLIAGNIKVLDTGISVTMGLQAIYCATSFSE